MPGREDCVYYHHFNDEIESIFTVKGLEKSPTAQVFDNSVFLIYGNVIFVLATILMVSY